ncbi:unnamed protein product [Cyprideis torosa]|uniref:Uncharacterized protein n=1 Tax=Cyprideis torosa TaxID=163714 RepID=A0A7R8ZIA5_9CRUS|nr:unnamed protein product [Cyprideis torosa]CAG0879548.1 unnamed protein product [Cyprideis torosa]
MSLGDVQYHPRRVGGTSVISSRPSLSHPSSRTGNGGLGVQSSRHPSSGIPQSPVGGGSQIPVPSGMPKQIPRAAMTTGLRSPGASHNQGKNLQQMNHRSALRFPSPGSREFSPPARSTTASATNRFMYPLQHSSSATFARSAPISAAVAGSPQHVLQSASISSVSNFSSSTTVTQRSASTPQFQPGQQRPSPFVPPPTSYPGHHRQAVAPTSTTQVSPPTTSQPPSNYASQAPAASHLPSTTPNSAYSGSSGPGGPTYAAPPQPSAQAPPYAPPPSSVQIRPSPSPSPITLPPNPTDEDLLKAGPREILRRLRKAEAEIGKILAENSNLVTDANKRIAGHVSEAKSLKDGQQRLMEDNQELRDLCCFLDDDRQKGRKLAREWQRFGRYTASVMRQEVSAYQNKLRDLERKQEELMKDNLELKELCLYLDEERHSAGGSTGGQTGGGGPSVLCSQCCAPLSPPIGDGSAAPTSNSVRDEGDGSSNSTNADDQQRSLSPQQRSPRQLGEGIPAGWKSRSLFNDQILRYIRRLEKEVYAKDESDQEGSVNVRHPRHHAGQESLDSGSEGDRGSSGMMTLSRPEAVVQAMRVLEVHEQLEKETCSDSLLRDATDETSGGGLPLGEGEKALLREMCNVVWRKLEDTPGGKVTE